MTIANCKTCSRVFYKTRGNYCPECSEVLQDKKELILEYVLVRTDVELEELCHQFAIDKLELMKLLATQEDRVPKPLLRFSCSTCERTMVTDFNSRNRHICIDCAEVLALQAQAKKLPFNSAMFAKCKLCTRSFIKRHAPLCHACCIQSNAMAQHLLAYPGTELSELSDSWQVPLENLQMMLIYSDPNIIPNDVQLQCTFCQCTLQEDNRSGLVCLPCKKEAHAQFNAMEYDPEALSKSVIRGRRNSHHSEFGLHRKR